MPKTAVTRVTRSCHLIKMGRIPRHVQLAEIPVRSPPAPHQVPAARLHLPRIARPL
jgi:hypothetical protein